MILRAPGRAPKYPQPEMEQAISELRAERRQVPILRDALHHPEWEIRRRAASALKILNGDAVEAITDLIEMLREARPRKTHRSRTRH
jgi:HEAT repeat protein